MKSEKELSDEYCAAAAGLSSTACSNALAALRVLAQDSAAANELSRIHQLTDHARKIKTSLQAGEKQYQEQNPQAANIEWANALVLMDALSVKTIDICTQPIVADAVKLQKSGKTA